MKRRIMACILVLSLLCAAGALADGEKTICVTATASISVEADRALLSLGVRTSAGDAAQASAENALQVDQLKEALIQNGIQESDISTSSYFVSPLYDYSGETESVRGYQVNHVLAVLVRDLDRTGDVIDLALASGANTCDGVSFQSSQASSAYDQALVLALKEGRRKAELISLGNGRILGDLLSVTENYGTSNGTYLARGVTVDATASGTQIMPEGLNCFASVTMVYAFQ